MDARQLIDKLVSLRPGLEASEQLRMGLLLSLQHQDLEALGADTILEQQCTEIRLQLNATSDQHAAVTDELDSLASTAPCEFTPEHLWTLVRAIKVQNQILNLYLSPAESSV